MPEVDLENKVISKKNAGFPEWLDFDKLRREGIDYLGELSGKIWTDHNVHDPGITILEMLCYALLDLGYRTSLPAKDLFSRDPSDQSEENNFFTPSQILGCNPLTISDYRRLLIDLPHVQNAWLTVAEDVTIDSICGRENEPRFTIAGAIYQPPKKNCIDFLNGLYHVYLDLEDGLSDKEKQDTVTRVKETLMAHRNLCEDFYDVTILCKQKVGVCADIELESGADAEKVFLQVVEKLKEFISPSPKFYRLKQLLEDKGKRIEEIFAGRPFDLTQSHGFVDIEEFGKIILRKEIYLSDVYNVIFNIPGVLAISNLSIQNCDGTICGRPSAWVFKIYENHVPEFSLLCSGFHFTRNGIDIVVDPGKFKEYFKLNFTNSNKTIITYPSPALDLEIPVGNFRPDIAEYFPIEEDFPKVYGIAEGSLPSESTKARKAQALQLRAYLLFFDHILAGYLSQLKNIRQLFSFRENIPPNNHTYFINKLSNWPGLAKLIRFSLDDSQGKGSTLAIPVEFHALNKLITDGRITDCDWEEKLVPYRFDSVTERDIAINQLIEDLSNGNYTEQIVTGSNECYSYYIQTSSDKFLVSGREQYKDEKDARIAMASLIYLATDKKNYKLYTTSSHTEFSFNIGSGMAGYWNYLQLLTENEKLYGERRNAFLDHLLARFAETFTDYALLSYSFFNEKDLLKNNISFKQKFLSNYPELSSQRGKAYDYLVNGWNNKNVSGVEKRFGAYTGSGEEEQKNLCHFEVIEYEQQVVVKVAWDKYSLFESSEPFENREEGEEALQSLMTVLNGEKNYQVSYSAIENKYKLHVRSGNIHYNHPHEYDTAEQAQESVKKLLRMFSPAPLPEDIIPSQYLHEILILKKQGKQSWKRQEPIINREPQLKSGQETFADFTDRTKWIAEEEDFDRDKIIFINNPDNPAELIDIKGFDPYVNRVDVKNQAIIYRYTVNDPGKMFLFISEEEFEDDASAKDHLTKLLFTLANPDNYQVSRNEKNEFILKILLDERLLATNTIEYQSVEEAEKAISAISEYVNDHIYLLRVDSRPSRWKYHLRLSLPFTKEFEFVSRKEYHSDEDALIEAASIIDPSAKYDIALNKSGELEIIDKDQPRKASVASIRLGSGEDAEENKDIAKSLLRFRKTVNKINLDRNTPETSEMVVRDKISAQGDFAYRLVKKDGYHAWIDLDGDFSNKIQRNDKIRQSFKAFTEGIHFTELCYGGENIVEIIEGGITWYHFQVRIRKHPYGPKDELVLFESVKGYKSSEQAQAAFLEQYVQILTAASDASNYGKIIGFEKIYIHDTDKCSSVAQQVFIPDETMKYYGQNTAHATQQLVELANAYPVKSIKKSEDLFARYFTCNKKEKINEVDCKKAAKEKCVYYFVLNHDYGRWVSYKYFSTAQEALKQFYFFLILLRYRGNYHIGYSDCDCSWKLYLREILAESKRRFPSREEAWGKTGVEKFICASQTENSFATYPKKDECCYTFHVACGNLGLIHPCTYDTPKKRDIAFKRLIRASKEFYQKVKDHDITVDWLKMAGEIDMAYSDRRSPCDNVIENIRDFISHHLDDVSRITAVHSTETAISSHHDLATGQLEKKKWFAHYFPVVKKEFGQGEKVSNRYYLDIRLPGFCNEDLSDPEPCGCDEKGRDTYCCCTAWVSECCFETCEDALDYYHKIAKCLADIDNYYTVFDCECGPFGIRFYCDCEKKHEEPERPTHSVTGTILHQPERVPQREDEHCCNEIIAVNPQCYTSPAMVCDAVKRAKELINSEGLHLVEHILLRPHCIDGDCNCIIDTCRARTLCDDFTWKLPDDDPCEKEKEYCFIPGTDPYSFIATAILPAWPERFRKKANRALVEQILYREMPAHVMLRILWLDPQDLCHFEMLYRNWTRWMGYKIVCGDHNPPCELIDFLFNQTLDCFDCEECIPCDEIIVNPDPCKKYKEEEKDPNEYVNAINRLFCWEPICPVPPPRYDYAHRLAIEPAIEESTESIAIDTLEAERKIDQRFSQYREHAIEVFRNSGNQNAEKAMAFLREQYPNHADYHAVIDDLVANKKSAEHKRILNTAEKRLLIEAVTWYYLDKILLDDKIDEYKSDLNELFLKLEKKELLPEYKNWKGREIGDYMPGAKVNEVKKLFK